MPADIRIVSASGMKVDLSSLTGESEAQRRSDMQTSSNPLETENLAFYTNNVVEGQCRGIVVRIGDNTYIGQLKMLMEGTASLRESLAVSFVSI